MLRSSYLPFSPRNLSETEFNSYWASPENNLSYDFSLKKIEIVILAALRNNICWSVSCIETERDIISEQGSEMLSSPCTVVLGLDKGIHQGERSAVQIREVLCAPKDTVLWEIPFFLCSLIARLSKIQNKLLHCSELETGLTPKGQFCHRSSIEARVQTTSSLTLYSYLYKSKDFGLKNCNLRKHDGRFLFKK